MTLEQLTSARQHLDLVTFNVNLDEPDVHAHPIVQNPGHHFSHHRRPCNIGEGSERDDGRVALNWHAELPDA